MRLIMLLIIIGSVAGCGQIITPAPVADVSATLLASPTLRRTLQPTETPPPTGTPQRATPVPTATPGVTATPHLYEVQTGDTLLKIAIQFDRSIEAIQTANGIVDARYLQIGQQLVIPPPAAGNPPTPTPTPLPLIVDSVHFQSTNQGTLWCLGEVYNPGPEALTRVIIEASLFDANGLLLARERAFTPLDVAPPDATVPFAVLFPAPPSAFAQYQVVAVSGLPFSDETRYYFDIAVFDITGRPEGLATYQLAGQLHNEGQHDAEAIRLVAIAYDADHRVLAHRQASLDVNVLKAGAMTSFDLDLLIPRGTVADYKVMVQALQAQ